jgi:hypothetical protein
MSIRVCEHCTFSGEEFSPATRRFVRRSITTLATRSHRYLTSRMPLEQKDVSIVSWSPGRCGGAWLAWDTGTSSGLAFTGVHSRRALWHVGCQSAATDRLHDRTYGRTQ